MSDASGRESHFEDFVRQTALLRRASSFSSLPIRLTPHYRRKHLLSLTSYLIVSTEHLTEEEEVIAPEPEVRKVFFFICCCGSSLAC